MLWYKTIGDIPHMFAYILFQIENMLNNFICHSNNYYDNIRNNEDKYIYKYTNEYLKDPFIIKVKDSFISKNNENIALEKIGIWAKYSFWFLETNRTAEFQKYTHSVISDVINIRNITEHRNSNKVIPQYTLKQIAYWQNSIEAKFSYIDLLLTTIMSTIKGF